MLVSILSIVDALGLLLHVSFDWIGFGVKLRCGGRCRLWGEGMSVAEGGLWCRDYLCLNLFHRLLLRFQNRSTLAKLARRRWIDAVGGGGLFRFVFGRRGGSGDRLVEDFGLGNLLGIGGEGYLGLLLRGLGDTWAVFLLNDLSVCGDRLLRGRGGSKVGAGVAAVFGTRLGACFGAAVTGERLAGEGGSAIPAWGDRVFRGRQRRQDRTFGLRGGRGLFALAVLGERLAGEDDRLANRAVRSFVGDAILAVGWGETTWRARGTVVASAAVVTSATTVATTIAITTVVSVATALATRLIVGLLRLRSNGSGS